MKTDEQFGHSSSPFLVSPSSGPGGIASYSFNPYEISHSSGPGGMATFDLGSALDDQRRVQSAEMTIRQIQPRSSPAQIINDQINAMSMIQRINDPISRDRLLKDLKFQLQMSGHVESLNQSQRLISAVLRICESR